MKECSLAFDMVVGLLVIALAFVQVANGSLLDEIPIRLDENGSNGCEVACSSLSDALGRKVHYKTLPKGFRFTYFSQQQREVTPKCVVFPGSSEDVSQVLQIVKFHNCHFAVKSGGHGMFAGASNANGGVTIDLRGLNGLKVSDDRLTTSIGTGRKWGKTYEVLEPMNLTVVGGRDTQIGAGGGISFISRRWGWGVDNVKNFEVVLANESITNVSYQSHPDLFFALRGAATQFGVITRFDVNTYPQGPVWGGHSFHLLEDVPERKQMMGIQNKFNWKLGWFVEKASNAATRFACRLGRCSTVEQLLEQFDGFSKTLDPVGQIILSFASIPYNINTWVACLSRLYGEPEPNPAVFEGFQSLDYTSIYSTNRVARLSDINAEVDWMNAVGYRQSWTTATFKIDLPFMSKLVDIYLSEIDAIKHVQGLLPSLIMQIITREEISTFQRDGGNAFGIKNGDGPFLLINNAIRWNNAEDDNTVKSAGNKIIDRAVALAKYVGVHHRFIYQNYANHSQDVFAGYGEENRERLQQIRKKYDPEGLFGKLQPGHFKL